MKTLTKLLCVIALVLIIIAAVAGCRSDATSGTTSKSTPVIKTPSLPPHAAKAGQSSNPHHESEHGDEHDESEHHHFAAQGSLVTNHGVPLLRESQSAGGFSPERRAQVVAERLNNMATTHGLEAGVLIVRRVNGYPTVFFFHEHSSNNQGHVLATIDPRTAKQFGFANRPEVLAYWWRDIVRDHALVIAGSPPRWTTRYAQPMQQLYDLCQKEQRGVPSHESFERALSKLSPAESEILSNLYMSVPANYQYVTDSPKPAGHQLRSKPREHEESGHHHH